MYRDAIDVGFFIRNEQSGRCAAYALHKEHKDDEGDLLYTEYHAVPRHPELITGGVTLAPYELYKNTVVIVYND